MIRRRNFIVGLGGAVATLPRLGSAVAQGTMVRRVGVLLSTFPADDSEAQARLNAFAQGLQERGWIDGRNVRIESRFGLNDPERLRKYAADLVALAPDVILAGSGLALVSLQEASSVIPIVFTNVTDPVGAGLVGSLARPGGNATGFMSTEFSFAGKWLEFLKQIAPQVTRVAVLRYPGSVGQFAAIQAVAPTLRMEITAVDGRDADETERGLVAFGHGPNDGLIVSTLGAQVMRARIIALADRFRLPAVYISRGYVAEGGLISYGPDRAEPYRLAAGYVDRILKGEKPAELPVQAPTKFDLTINLKTAKALGIKVPPTLLAIADEVIE